MKKIWLLLGMAVLLSGCAKESRREPKVQVEETPNPVVEVQGTQDFVKAGADIEPPAGAENARFYMIAEKVAEIRFTRNDTEYSYRASQFEENPAGIQAKASGAEEIQAVVGDCRIPIQEAEGVYLAVWKWGEISYSLTAGQSADKEKMKSLVEELARETMPARV